MIPKCICKKNAKMSIKKERKNAYVTCVLFFCLCICKGIVEPKLKINTMSFQNPMKNHFQPFLIFLLLLHDNHVQPVCTFLSCTFLLILIFKSTVYCHAHFYILFFISYSLLISFSLYQYLCIFPLCLYSIIFALSMERT